MYEQEKVQKARYLGYGIGLGVVVVLMIGKFLLKF
jgi:hypothetical protein